MLPYLSLILLPLIATLSLSTAHADNLAQAERAYVRGDHSQAQAAYRRDAQRGVALAQFNYAMMLKRGEGVERTEAWQPWLKKAATQGLPEAAYVLGLAFENGEGLPRSQPDATHWFLQAAKRGHTQAQLSVATQYYLGRGTDRDMAQAAYWYEKAAQGGDVGAQYLIASMYEHGEGIATDRSQALLWYSAAARQGDVAARLKAEAIARQR